MRENETMMNQQQKHPQTYKETDIDWRGLAGACILIPLLYLIGPLVIIVGLLLQRWATTSAWKAPDRWASIRTLAWLGPLLYIPIWLFREPIALFWSAHLPGQFLLWPLTFDGLLARWILVLPFAPALTFLLEQGRPLSLNMRYIVRRPRPGEIIAGDQETGLSLASTTTAGRAQKPAATSSQKKASTTKTTTTSSTARKKTERDPRPIGVAWAEQTVEEQQKKEAEERKRTTSASASAPAPTTQPKLAGEPGVAEPTEDEATMPDPFKAKKYFDWSKVKE